jgi:exonuclease SbcC
MASTHDNAFDPTKPALVLLYGNSTKKHRVLDRNVLLIGRARGCDLGLEAPDVSSVHCLIMRGADAFHLRDCQSRAGTKLNGNLVREASLHDGDVLQVGPFSFRVHLPGGCTSAEPAPDNSRWQHVERSRRKLAQIALRQRKLLRFQHVLKQDSNAKDSPEPPLNQQASSWRARIRAYDQRVRLLEDAERSLNRDRETLHGEAAAFRLEVQRSEQELARRRQEADAELEAKYRQLEERCRQEKERPMPTGQPAAAGDKADDVDRTAERQALDRQQELVARQQHELAVRAQQIEQQQQVMEQQAAQHAARERDLERRAAEFQREQQTLERQHQQRQRDFDALARQLQFRDQQLEGRIAPLEQERQRLEAERLKLDNQQQSISRIQQDLEREQKEFSMMRDQWAKDHAVILSRVAQQKAALAQAEETLREQRQGLDDLLANLQEGRAAVDPEQAGEVEQLRQENQRLRQQLAEHADKTGPAEEAFLQLKHENEDLKHLLAALERERERAEAAAAEAKASASQGQRHQDPSGEIELLRKLLEEKNDLLEELRSKVDQPPVERDIQSYEAELNGIQRQLEHDRQKLNQEIDQMRVRNDELDQATREMELEMSRERAELARERQRLERLREDVRLELERMQRESGMRERLATVQNLRDEINSRRQPGSG